MSSSPEAVAFTVVIPAHNERAVIRRLLESLYADTRGADADVLLVCNGCRDGTAGIARAFARELGQDPASVAGPGLRVLELERPSKPAALNAGIQHARAHPVFFVDADVTVSLASLAACAESMRDTGSLVAAPPIEFGLEACSPLVRAYFDVWTRSAYIRDDLVGSGVYGLSKEALQRLGRFPDIVGDDALVHAMFDPAERLSVGPERHARARAFRVEPPRTLAALLSVETRRRSADHEMTELLPARWRSSQRRQILSLLGQLAAPGRWPAMLVYAYVKIASRLRHRRDRERGRGADWLRDETSRRLSA